jgi:hypothetical protein
MAISGILSSQNHYNQRASGFWPTSVTAAAAAAKSAIFGYGYSGAFSAITNLVSSTGVVSADTTGVGSARAGLAAAGYSTDKALFGYGQNAGTATSVTNLVSSTGVVATNTTGVGTARDNLAAAEYGTDKAIFGYGGTYYSLTNLVSNTGVVGNDVTGVGTVRNVLAAAGYGTDKAIFGYGQGGEPSYLKLSMTNLVSNTGVVANDVTGVGSARLALAAASYGTDKAIFGYGYDGVSNGDGFVATTNLVSNTGVVATNTTGVGTRRTYLAAARYGTDKAIFGYGSPDNVVNLSMTNLVSNTGVVAIDTTGVGTARRSLAAAAYG